MNKKAKDATEIHYKTTDYKPWEEYPNIWATESQFWTYLRGSLRRGVWEKSPIKITFKNKNCHKPPKGYTGRAKSGAECALTGQWVGKSKLQVDHITGEQSLTCWEDVLPFIQHLIPPNGSLQLVDPDAHKIKSYAEKQGISFEEACIQKEAIAIQKGNDKAWLKRHHIVPATNAKLRREQIVNFLRKSK